MVRDDNDSKAHNAIVVVVRPSQLTFSESISVFPPIIEYFAQSSVVHAVGPSGSRRDPTAARPWQ